MTCDRCGAEGLDVVMRTDCADCGPVPLCDECERVHEGEKFIEDQMFGRG